MIFVDQLLFCLQESKVECVSIIYREIVEIKPPFELKMLKRLKKTINPNLHEGSWRRMNLL